MFTSPRRPVGHWVTPSAFEPRGLLDIKGKGSMETYFVCRRKKEAGTL
jgi:hypothetical protein